MTSRASEPDWSIAFPIQESSSPPLAKITSASASVGHIVGAGLVLVGIGIGGEDLIDATSLPPASRTRSATTGVVATA